MTDDKTLFEQAQEDPSDALLVQRTAAGDQKAFELLVIKYQRRIQRLIARMVRNPELVEDIAQETFIRAYRALPHFRGESLFYTWLYRIAINTTKKILAELKHEPTSAENLHNSVLEDETFSSESALTSIETPDAVLASKEVAQVVNAAVQSLPEDLRLALTLRELEGLSYEEIAVLADCPIGTVRSRIFRAREEVSAKVRPLLADKSSGKRW